MKFVLLAVYILLSTGGATLVKLGGNDRYPTIVNVPVANVRLTWMTLTGVIGYGLSFLLFMVLISKLNISFLTPIATGVSYLLLMLVSVVVFNEAFSVAKTIGCVLILAGVLCIVVSDALVAA
ncbi:MAG: hypothetical protein LBV30_04775 [Propionibacteriaceae bacterium]|jgi:multidrug transporter EmrE-like cation transporter|nr:hypothetical protein [Propionibacteriaceae bacterium]